MMLETLYCSIIIGTRGLRNGKEDLGVNCFIVKILFVRNFSVIVCEETDC